MRSGVSTEAIASLLHESGEPPEGQAVGWGARSDDIVLVFAASNEVMTTGPGNTSVFSGPDNTTEASWRKLLMECSARGRRCIVILGGSASHYKYPHDWDAYQSQVEAYCASYEVPVPHGKALPRSAGAEAGKRPCVGDE